MTELDPSELGMHNCLKNDILGTKGRTNFPNNSKSNIINLKDNEILKDWLCEVKIKLL